VLVVALGVLAGLLALVDWYAVVRDRRELETWAKPATLAGLTATTVAAGALDASAGRWLVAALLLGLLGDVALLGRSNRRFLLGLIAFLLGHLAYVVCFLVLGVEEGWWMVVGAGVVVVAFLVGREVLPAAVAHGGKGFGAAVATYMCVIGATTVTGWATALPLVAAGTAVFVASDTTLALDRFVAARPHGRIAVMVTYHVGQALIAAGVLLAL